MPLVFRKVRSTLAAAGAKISVPGVAVGHFPVMGGREFLEADFKVLDTDAPMLLGLITQQSWSWEINKQTNTVSILSGSLLPLKQTNGHLFIHREPPEDQNDPTINAVGDDNNPAPAVTQNTVPSPSRPAAATAKAWPTPEHRLLFRAEKLRKIHARRGH